MAVLFIYILIGYGAARREAVDDEFGRKLSWVVLNVANPALVVSAVVNGDGSIQGRDFLMTAGLAAAILGCIILIARILPILFRVEKGRRRAYMLLFSFNNVAYMGFPLIAAAYGQEALLYGAVFNMLFNVFAYTYGIEVICGEGEKKARWKQVLNIGVVSCILAIAIYITRLPFPSFLKTVVSGLGGLTSPLSMMVIGISLAKIPFGHLFTDAKLLSGCAVKLVLVPIIAMAFITRAIDNEMLCGVCMVMLATPAASMTAMLAGQYGSEEDAELVAKGVALTTILSVATIPLVSMIVF